MDWAHVLENALPVLAICGLFFLWLRQDNKRLEDKMDGNITKLRNDMTKQSEKLRKAMNAGFAAMESRPRGVETEQARVAGLLEGLALKGRLPEREGALD